LQQKLRSVTGADGTGLKVRSSALEVGASDAVALVVAKRDTSLGPGLGDRYRVPEGLSSPVKEHVEEGDNTV
jgi:hypothetical protein